MKLIIDIPENVIEGAKLSSNYYPTYYFEIWRAVANGIPYDEKPQNEKHEAICEEITTDGHCNCWTPCPNKEERPQGDCNNCDFRKFSEKFVDAFVNKNDITSFEQLSEILKGGAEC